MGDLGRYEAFLVKLGYPNAASEKKTAAIQPEGTVSVLLHNLEILERHINESRES